MRVRSVSEVENQESRDGKILEHLPLVRAIAIRVHETLPVHVELDDLVHAGVLGLIDAVARFDESKQVSFQNYAKFRIRGAILDSLREMDWASRDMRRRQKRLEATVRELANELGRSPFDHEVASRLGVSSERWNRMMMEMRSAAVSDSSVREDGEPMQEHAGHASWRPDMICEKRELTSKLAGAMKALPERHRKIVLMYYTEGMSMREIGASIGVNESRVSQIHKVALEKMARTLRAEGVTSARAL